MRQRVGRPFCIQFPISEQASTRNERKTAQIRFFTENRHQHSCCLPADIPQMTISQMHDRLRTVLLRKIQRGQLTVSLLSRQTGLAKSHVSKFLHGKGRLSMQALDRVLERQHLVAEDLVQFGTHAPVRAERVQAVPVVSHSSALFEPEIRPSAIRMWLPLPFEQLESLAVRRVMSRRSWRRFVAIQISGDDATSMDPVVYEGAIAVIDRHYNSLDACHPPRQNMYAVRDGRGVALRYVDAIGTYLLTRPLSIEFSADLIEIAAGGNAGDYIAGRVAFILNEL